MNSTVSQQEIVDSEHLRLLRIGYFVSAATNLLWVFFPLIYVAMGALMLFGAFDGAKPSDAPPKVVGLVFMSIGIAISLIMASFTVLKLLTARPFRALAFLGGRHLVFSHSSSLRARALHPSSPILPHKKLSA
jgi:hypothetical protein